MTDRVALYRLYDDEDHLLYVGVAEDPKRRFRQHKGDKPWWPEVSMRAVEWFPDSEAALAEERQAIRNELPRHNDRSVVWRPELGGGDFAAVTVAELAEKPYGLVKQVESSNEPVVITRYGRPVAVLCPVDQIAKGK